MLAEHVSRSKFLYKKAAQTDANNSHLHDPIII